MNVRLLKYPTDEDWKEAKRRALITVYGKGIGEINPPDESWKKNILDARHSPIRYLRYSFLIEDIPSNTSVHLCRHVHAQPYVSSLRNDRQDVMDGDKAPRDTPVNMILDVNAEELMVIANKRLCNKASSATRRIVSMMCIEASLATPEIKPFLVPMCRYHGGVCHEMIPCKRGAGIMSRCKSCGKEIIWIKTVTGKNMPCDTEPIPYRKDAGGDMIIITPHGDVVRASFDSDMGQTGYTSHFATCPNAAKHRRKK